MEKLCVFTLNIWSGFRYNGLIRLEEYESPEVRELRFQGLLREIKRLRPDVLCLGEINPLPVLARRIASAAGMRAFTHMGVAGVRAGRFGLPLNLREGDGLFVSPELEPRWIGRAHLSGRGYCGNTFSFHFSNLTQALLGKLRLADGRDCYVCATHFTAAPDDSAENRRILEAYADQMGCTRRERFRAGRRLSDGAALRATEVNRLLAFLRARVPEGAPLILAGDLNAESSWMELRMLQDAGFTDLAPCDPDRKTWDPRYNRNLMTYYVEDARRSYHSPYKKLEATDELFPRNIDHILVRNLPPQREDCCKICAYEPIDARNISDHFGLIAELELGSPK